MEFSEEPPLDQCLESNTIYVKQEFEDTSNIPNSAEVTNTECSRPTTVIEGNNPLTDDIKQESTEEPSSTRASREDFVFVACDDSVAFHEAETPNVSVPCPYCGKSFLQIRKHKMLCESRFVYSCTLCPNVLTRRGIKRHITMQHSFELNSASQTVDEVFKDIIANRKELIFSTLDERRTLIVNLKHANAARRFTQRTCTQVSSGISIVTNIQQELIIPDPIDSHQVEMQSSKPSFVLMATQTSEMPTMTPQTLEMPNVVQIQNVGSWSTAETQGLNMLDKSTEQPLIVFDSSEKSNDPLVVEEINTPVDTETQDRPVSTKNAKAKRNSDELPKKVVYCNECEYKTNRKAHLKDHLVESHSSKLNLPLFKCYRCEKTFQERKLLQAHTAECNVKYYYPCIFCKQTLASKENALRHVLFMHTKEAMKKKTDEIIALIESKKNTKKRKDDHDSNDSDYKPTKKAPKKNAAKRKDDHDSNDSDYKPTKKAPKKNAAKKKDDHDAYSKNSDCETSKTAPKKNAAKRKDDHDVYSKETTKNAPKKNAAKGKDDHDVYSDECDYTIAKKARLRLLNHIKKSQTETSEQRELNLKADDVSRTLATKKAENTKTKTSLAVVTEMSEQRELNLKADDVSRTLATKKAENTKTKTRLAVVTKSKYFCDHCRYKSIKKSNLVRHMKKTHFAKKNLQSKGKTKEISSLRNKYNYKCVFCPIIYCELLSVKNHVQRQHPSELEKKSMDEISKDICSKKILAQLKSTVEVAKTTRKAKFKHPKIDPYEMDGSTLEHILVYCYKCKHIKSSFCERRKRLRNCEDCGTLMIYLCPKCKKMNSLQFCMLAKHWELCTDVNNISQHILDELTIYTCSECPYIGTHKHKFKSHIVRSKHKPADTNNDGGEMNLSDNEEMKMYDEDKFAIKRCVTDFFSMTARYCPKCDKVVTEEMQERKRATNEDCQVCGTRFHYECVKCNMRYKIPIMIRYHINSVCYPGIYECIQCKKRTPSWQLMRKHYMILHTNKRDAFLCEFCSFRSRHRTNFWKHMKIKHPEQSEHIIPPNVLLKKQDIDYVCDDCGFTSKRKSCVKMHLQNVHGKKKHKCKLCKFKTKYEASLKRHVVTRHKNHY